MSGKGLSIVDVLGDIAAKVKKDAAEFSKTNVAETAEGKKVAAKPTKQWIDASIQYELTQAQGAVSKALAESVESML